MAGKLTGLAQLFDPGLILSGIPPLTEKEYRVPLPSAELGLWCRTVGSAGAAIHFAATEAAIESAKKRFESLPDLGVEDLAQAVLGQAYNEMVADGVSDAHIQFCASTAYVWILGGCGEQGEEMARRFWESGGRLGEPQASPNRAARRAAARTGATSTAAARTTKKAASTSGTKSPRTSSASTKPKRTRSTGSTS